MDQLQLIIEPPHDKTNKMTVHPAKTQISLDIHPAWSESLLCAQWVAKDPSFLHADSKDCSDWADAQVDPSLRWGTCHFVGLSCDGSYVPGILLKGTLANSVDPDQIPQNATSDQGLHCLHTGISVQNRIRMNKSTRHPLNWQWTSKW